MSAPQLDSLFAALSDPTKTRHHRSTTRPRRTERWRGRGSLCHQHTCHHAALAGAGGGWIDRAPDRATVALCTRACERVGADGKLARTAAAALVGGTGPYGSGGGRSNAQAKKVMSDTETTLRIERPIASPPEVLFALWIEPAQLLKWWAPDGYQASVDVLDANPAGAGAPPCADPMAVLSRPAGLIASSNRRTASPSPGPGR